ncbi:MAG: deoxyribose-phosphate aldolase [Treponema sp.]|nr:deoxyribose-phosphate aldolase [Treponema sp.]
MTKQDVAKLIDHTQLGACATSADIERLCEEARTYGFASVCVNPCFVPMAHDLLDGNEIKVCTVIGFPLGADAAADKTAQARNAIASGADEIDMVINLGLVKEGDYESVEDDIRVVVADSRVEAAALSKTVIVKVILETCYLTDEEIEKCCLAAKEAGADFVKTSTGFATPKDSAGKALPNGATVHAVELMKKTVGDSLGIKASGGIRSAEDARAMIEAGATRIGASSGVAIVENWKD